MRRLLAVATAGLALLVAAPESWAQDSIPATYAGSRETTEDSQATGAPRITARFIRRYNPQFPENEQMSVSTRLTSPGGLASGCPGSTTHDLFTTQLQGDELYSTDTAAVGSAPCNGTYSFTVTAVLDRPFFPDDVAELHGTVDVVAPAAAPPSASAAQSGSAVTVTWGAVASPPADFLGYRVERREAGAWKPIAGELGRAATSFTDATPGTGGEAVYRIRSRRAGPRGEVLSPTGPTAQVTLGGTDGSSTSVPGTDGGTGGTGTGGTGGPGGTAGDPGPGGTGGTGGTGGGSGGGTGGGRSPQSRGRTGVGTKAPRLGTPSAANFPPLLTPDEGFDEEIDYGDGALAGEEEDDELSSLFYEEEAGRGMAVPVATGLVLAAWAFHFRFLAKAARPVPVASRPAPTGPPVFEGFEPPPPPTRADAWDPWEP